MAACTRLVRSTLSVTASDIKTPIHGLKHTRIATSVGECSKVYKAIPEGSVQRFVGQGSLRLQNVHLLIYTHCVPLYAVL